MVSLKQLVAGLVAVSITLIAAPAAAEEEPYQPGRPPNYALMDFPYLIEVPCVMWEDLNMILERQGWVFWDFVVSISDPRQCGTVTRSSNKAEVALSYPYFLYAQGFVGFEDACLESRYGMVDIYNLRILQTSLANSGWGPIEGWISVSFPGTCGVSTWTPK